VPSKGYNTPKGGTIGNYYEHKLKERTHKTDPGTALRDISGMQRAGRAGQDHSGTTRPQTLGHGRHTQKDQISGHRCSGQPEKTGQKTASRISRAIPTGIQRAQRDQRRSGCRRARAVLAKKKDELKLKGPLTGHFKKEVKVSVVNIIKEAISNGFTQKRACETFGIVPRKFRRWTVTKPPKPRVAWNKLTDDERLAIENAIFKPELLDKPLSHIFVHGHDSESFFASLSSVYRVLKAKDLVKPFEPRRKTIPYVSAHSLLDEGFSLLCYDGTQIRTEYGVNVWAIPVIILPQRYLLYIGHSLQSVPSGELARTVKEAYSAIPEHLTSRLLAHSDRGSAMKSSYTTRVIKELLGAPVHFGRPHTPDDQAWIESFIHTLKYHRDAPKSFKLVDDVLNWLKRFPDIYNNDPHSSLSYVTPLQALSGQKEVILAQRKQNLATARLLRYTAWLTNRQGLAADTQVVHLQPV
jgi:putative transposase